MSENTLFAALKAVDEHLQGGDVNAAQTALDDLRRVTVPLSDQSTRTDTERALLRDLIDAARTGHWADVHLKRGDIEAARAVVARQLADFGASS